MEQPTVTLAELLLEVGRRADLARVHRAACLRRLNAAPCADCLNRQADWLSADLAVSRFLAAAESAEAVS